jgi:hypothetical protein
MFSSFFQPYQEETTLRLLATFDSARSSPWVPAPVKRSQREDRVSWVWGIAASSCQSGARGSDFLRPSSRIVSTQYLLLSFFTL